MALDSTLATGGSTSGKVNVDSDYNLQVVLPGRNANGTVRGGGEAQAGAVTVFSQNDAGTLTGSQYVKSPETSSDYRLRVGMDTVLFTDTFNYSAQNTHNWSYTFNTLTMSQPGNGYLQIGTVQGTTNAHGAFMRTFQYFPLIGTAPLYVEFTLGLATATLVANEVLLFGLGLPSAATTPPTDGVDFMLTSAGLIGEVRYNGTPTQTGVLAPLADFTVGTMFKLVLVIGEGEIEYWRDDVMLGEQEIPVANGQPFIQAALPAYVMKYNTGAVSNTNTVRVTDLTISLADLQTAKPWPHQLGGMGAHCAIGQPGQTMGSTAGNVLNTNGFPASAAGSNTASALTTGLGGIVQVNAAAGATTAGANLIATSFQNPTPGINTTGRNLYITGVKVSAINFGAAVATTPTTLLWMLHAGHTALSLATAETASFATATTKAPRNIPLGFMSAAIGAVVGAPYDKELNFTPQVPIVVRPGEYVATSVRFVVGTATASQTVVAIVAFDGYWE